MHILKYQDKEMVIIKKLLTITLSILMIGSIATGCGKKDVAAQDTPVATNTNTTTTTTKDAATSSNANSNATKSAETKKTTEVTINTPAVKTNIVKTPVVAQQPFYGQWKIIKQIAYGPVSIYSNDDVTKMVGKTINYSDVEAVYGTVICKDPYYKKSTVTRSSFETSNKTRFSTLGITTNSVDKYTVFTNSSSNNIWNSTGSIFYVKDQNTLILFDGGVYFQLTKVTN